MGLRDVTASRSIWSYTRVQKIVAPIVRNKKFQLRKSRVVNKHYLDLGCGPNINPHVVNADYLWHQGIDLCWDFTKGLPFGDERFLGIFSEHCLEHFPLPLAEKLLKECFRALKEDGTLRLVVPDAETYLRTYVSKLDGDKKSVFPYEGRFSFDGISSPVLDVNRFFYQDRASAFGHWFMYDAGFLIQLLSSIGFRSVEKCSFRQGRDERLLLDSESRRVESLYVEAAR